MLAAKAAQVHMPEPSGTMHASSEQSKPAPWHSHGAAARASMPQRIFGNQSVLRMLAPQPAVADADMSESESEREEAPLPDQPCRCHAAPAGILQTKLVIGAVNDPMEHEAERIADQVMRAPAASPPAISSGGAAVNRACVACEEEERKDRLVRAKPAARGGMSDQGFAPPAVHDALASSGQPLDASGRAFAEQRLGRDFGGVRVHADATADRAARAIGARAFTVGRDIAFASGEYMPATPAGQHLLLHELVHVAQQENAPGVVRRAPCSHDGTPPNCHNFALPLPPWLAGIIAHQQVAVWAGIPAHSIPRASKRSQNKPSTPTTPWGFADLWQNASDVNIGEIKSTKGGSLLASQEAEHYILRHTESTLRGPGAADDDAYQAAVGGSKTGKFLDLSSRTGGSAGIPIGPFAGDPLKTLNVEANDLGAVVYWCTGVGAVNPLWLKLFKDAVDELKKQFAKLKRMMADIIDGLVEGVHAFAKWISDLVGDIVEWGEKNSRALALGALIVILLVAIIALILSILAEPASGGTSTVGVIASIATLATSAAGIMALLGFSSPTLKDAAVTTASALHPAEADAAISATDYDPVGDTQPTTLAAAVAAKPADPSSQLIAALKPFTTPDTIANAAVIAFKGGANNADGLAALKSGVQTLRAGGDDASAAAIEKQMKSSGLA